MNNLTCLECMNSTKLKQHGLTDSRLPRLLLLINGHHEGSLTPFKCCKVATLQFTLMSNEPYLRNWVFKLDGINCIWWQTNRTNRMKCIIETKFVGNIFNNYVSSWGHFFWHVLYDGIEQKMKPSQRVWEAHYCVWFRQVLHFPRPLSGNQNINGQIFQPGWMHRYSQLWNSYDSLL